MTHRPLHMQTKTTGRALLAGLLPNGSSPADQFATLVWVSASVQPPDPSEYCNVFGALPSLPLGGALT